MDEQLAQSEIEKLLAQAQAGKTDETQPPAEGTQATEDVKDTQSESDQLPNTSSREQPKTGKSVDAAGALAQGDIDLLFQQAQSALASIEQPEKSETPGVIPFRLEDFSGEPASSERATIELVNDVELNIEIELGRTRMYLEDVLKLHKGSIVSLNKLAGDPVDVYINGRHVARGEVLVLNDNFCVRIAELIAGDAVG